MSNPRSNYLQAVESVLGAADILTEGERFQGYLKSTYPADRRVLAVLFPANSAQIQKIVQASREHRQPIHVISTGKNWGYGCALPSKDGAVIVSLERMREIKFDSESLGTVWIEPGVTQEMLYQFLQRHAPHFVTPITGSSPECSVLGNALERGFGIAPIYDHCHAVQALQAVLPSGDLYQSPYLETGAHQSAGVFRHGIGPHIDSLFPQGSFGIVTSAIIQLKRMAEEYLTVVMTPRADVSLGQALEKCRKTLYDTGIEYTPLKAFNARYVQDLYRPEVMRERGESPITSEKINSGSFAICGVVAGSRATIRAARVEIRSRLRHVMQSITLIDTRQFARLNSLMRLFPGNFFPVTRFKISNASLLHRYTRGIPSRASLSLVYGADRQRSGGTRTGNPAVDGSGLLWLPIVCQFTGQSFDALCEIVISCCREFNFPEVINAASLNPSAICLLVSLLFNPDTDRERAHQCMTTLLERTTAAGYAPYRIHGEYFGQLFDAEESPYCKLARNLRSVADPDGILVPRYPFE